MKTFTLNLLVACGLFYSCSNTSTTDATTTEARNNDTTSTLIEEARESISASVTPKETVKEPTAAPVNEPAKQIPLTVIVEKLVSAEAPIEMSIYSPGDDFPAPKGQTRKYRWRPKKGKAVTKIDNLPYGNFAIALYQDVNDNGKIDKNMIGIPEEPYAFSKDYKPVVKAPSFNDCQFSYSPTENTITITLLN